MLSNAALQKEAGLCIVGIIVTIAIVDDEKNIRLTVKSALEKEGFAVQTFADGAQAYSAFAAGGTVPALYILDIMMPAMDGLSLLRKLREGGYAMPVMFLTSKDEEFDRVLGLELGADDYLCKPFSLRELVARVHVLLRRCAMAQGGTMAAQKPADTLSIDAISLNRTAYTAAVGGEPLELTVTEFRLLETFLLHRGEVLTRDQLIQTAYPEDTYLNDRAIDCHIKRLRKKIGSERIETVYGLGYRFP